MSWTGSSTRRCAIRETTASIPHTLSGDGDPCDVLVINTRAITPGAMMSVRPVGVLFMEDRGRAPDEKIVAVPASRLTRRYDSVKSYRDLPSITVEQSPAFLRAPARTSNSQKNGSEVMR